MADASMIEAGTHPRPWIDHYPPGIEWDVEIDTTPVHEQVLAICARQPEADALDFMGARTTYGQMGEQINALAGALQHDLGVTRGTRVALLMPNSSYFPIVYYAVLRAGGTVVNCNPLYTVDELAHIASNSGAELLVTVDLVATFPKAEALMDAGHIKRVLVCHFADALPMVKRLLFTVARARDVANVKASKFHDSIINYADLIAKRLAPIPVEIDPRNDIAVQQYTGGTTGLPRGALLSHANIAANADQIHRWSANVFDPPSTTLAVLPFFHIFAMTCCINLPLTRGGQVVMLPRFELKPFIETVARTRPTVLPAVPTLLRAVAKSSQATPEIFSSLKIVVAGGAALNEETLRMFARLSANATIGEGYGLTEASPVVCCTALTVPGKPLSIGQPIPGTDVRLVDIDTGKVVGIGERGEMQVRGPQVMAGYYNDADASAGAFEDGWLRTGDVGILDEDGYFFIVDRIKDLIISSGFNVYPRTIEEALYTHPAVDETNVIGVPDEFRGEAPVAFIKLKPDQTVTEQELRRFLGERLNKLEVPREIIFKEELPKTLIGKLSKKELREEYLQRDTTGATSEPV